MWRRTLDRLDNKRLQNGHCHRGRSDEDTRPGTWVRVWRGSSGMVELEWIVVAASKPRKSRKINHDLSKVKTVFYFSLPSNGSFLSRSLLIVKRGESSETSSEVEEPIWAKLWRENCWSSLFCSNDAKFSRVLLNEFSSSETILSSDSKFMFSTFISTANGSVSVEPITAAPNVGEQGTCNYNFKIV